MFAGYLTVDEVQDTQYFYWFAECDGCDAATAPVALWTNGGPGCSGLLGFMTEQGPFRPQADGSLAANPYAWNKVANYLFIEQPVGVGFSYSTTPAAYNNVGDDEAAALNYNLILQFLAKFPQYKANEFFISAESYGGHYMPTLAKQIVDSDPNRERVNFQGFAVGNPYTDPVENVIGSIDTLYGHSMVPEPTYKTWLELCRNGKGTAADCEVLQAKMQYQDIGNVNPYALDYPVCLEPGSGRPKLSAYQARTAYSLLPRAAQAALGLPGDPEDYDPCTDDYTLTYLNRADVKAAIHANSALDWLECSGRTAYGTLKYNYTWSEVPMEPYYEYLVASDMNLRIMVFSGDDDSICGTVGTQSWIYNYWPIKSGTAWKAWELEGQVAGYVEKFDGLTFATVHGAGHEVPTYKPAQALKLIGAYFNGSSWLF